MSLCVCVYVHVCVCVCYDVCVCVCVMTYVCVCVCYDVCVCVCYACIYFMCVYMKDCIFHTQCRGILKLTSVMMLPQSSSIVDPIELITVVLLPREETGLVSLNLNMHHLQLLSGYMSLYTGLFHSEDQARQSSHQPS